MRSAYMTVPDNEFFQAFGRLEGKIDLLLRMDGDKEQRIRRLEKWSWMVIGGAAVVSYVVSHYVK